MPLRAGRWKRWFGVVIAMVIGVSWGCWRLGIPWADPDTPVEQAPSNENSFVGMKRCAECHADHSASFVHTGHAMTFAPTRDMSDGLLWNDRTFQDSERKQTFRYSFDPRA